VFDRRVQASVEQVHDEQQACGWCGIVDTVSPVLDFLCNKKQLPLL
jgi:hypothetical protein